jgi:hypothetical protein
MRVKEYREHLDSTLKNMNRDEFWEKCFIAAMNGIITSAPADAGSTARMAAQYADAMVEQWEKRR